MSDGRHGLGSWSEVEWIFQWETSLARTRQRPWIPRTVFWLLSSLSGYGLFCWRNQRMIRIASPRCKDRICAHGSTVSIQILIQAAKHTLITAGNMIELMLEIPGGETASRWFGKYGNTFKFHACFGVGCILLGHSSLLTCSCRILGREITNFGSDCHQAYSFQSIRLRKKPSSPIYQPRSVWFRKCALCPRCVYLSSYVLYLIGLHTCRREPPSHSCDI